MGRKPPQGAVTTPKKIYLTLRPRQQPPNIGAVLEDDERRDQRDENALRKIAIALSAEDREPHGDHEKRRRRAAAERDVVRDGEDEREKSKRSSDERGRKADKHAKRSRNALPAVKAPAAFIRNIGRQHVAKDTHHADRERQPRNVRCEIPRGERREEALQDIARKSENSPLLADGTKDIRRADVLRPDSANVDAAHFADEKTERNSPDEIGADKPDGYDDADLHM